MAANSAARRQIIRIQILRRELKLDEESYRNVLWGAVAGTESSKDLDEHGRLKVIRLLESHTKKATKTYPKRPHNADAKDRRELKKIEALLTDAGMPWSYAESIMKRQTRGKKERLEFCTPSELAGIIAALEKTALKRLERDLTAELNRLGYTFDWGSHVATVLGLTKSNWALCTSTQTMSELLRWLRGEFGVYCQSPVDLNKPQCCHCCYEKAHGREFGHE